MSIVIIVNILVNSDNLNDFIHATKKSQEATLKEDGCNRYDILQDSTIPNKITLVEEYENEEAINAHKETLHFQEWRNTVNPMGERTSSKKYLL